MENKWVVIQPIAKRLWQSMSEEDQDLFARETCWASVVAEGEPLGDTFSYHAHEEATIQGLRLFPEDEDGNPIPEYVMVRSEILVRSSDGSA